MEQPLIVEFFKVIFKPIIRLLGYFLCFPQLLLKEPKLRIIKDYQCDNITQIIFTTIFLMIYHTIYLNLHLLYIFKFFSLVDSNFELFIAFLIFYSFTATFYYSEDIRYFIVNDLWYLMILIFNIFQWIFIVLSFAFRWDTTCIDLIFGNNYNIGIRFHLRYLGIINIIFYTFETIFIFILNLLLLAHLINPLSILRIPGILIEDYRKNRPNYIFVSFLFVFFDFYILLLYLINIPFIFSFIGTSFKIIEAYFFFSGYSNFNRLTSRSYSYFISNDYSLNDLFGNPYLTKYIYIAFGLIYDTSSSNILFICELFNKYIKPLVVLGKTMKIIKYISKHSLIIIFSSTNLLFFWRIKVLINNIKKFKNEDDIFAFILASFTYNISAFTDLIFLVIYILNRIFIWNYGFLIFYEKNIVEFMKQNSTKNSLFTKDTSNHYFRFDELKDEQSFSLLYLFRTQSFFEIFLNNKFYCIKLLNFQVFFHKFLDLIVSVLSLINIISPTFYIKLYNYQIYKYQFSKVNDQNEILAQKFIDNFYLVPLFSIEFNKKLLAVKRNEFYEIIKDEISKTKENKVINSYLLKLNACLNDTSRIIVMKNILKDFKFGFLFLLNFITIIDPFSGFLHIFNIFKFLGRVKMIFNKHNVNRLNKLANCSISKIISEEITISSRLFFEFLIDLFIRIPLILISILLFPFNIFKSIIFCMDTFYVYFYRKIKENNLHLSKLNSNSNERALENYEIFLKDASSEIEIMLNLKKDNFIKSVFKKFLKSWTTLFKFVCIHLSLIRAIYLYHDIFTLNKFYKIFKNFITNISKLEEFLSFINFMNKNNENKAIDEDVEDKINLKEEENCNLFVKRYFSEIKLLRILNISKKFYSKKHIFIFYDQTSWIEFYNKNFLNQKVEKLNDCEKEIFLGNNFKKIGFNEIELNTLKKIIDESITISYYIENIIDDNFNQLYKEIIFYPIIIVAFTTNPLIFYFGFYSIKSNDYNIFRQRKFVYKLKICLNIIFEYFKIMLNIIKIVILIVTLIKVPDLFTILYYYIRALFSKDSSYSYFKHLIDEHYEGQFTKDLNKLLLEALNFYFVFILFIFNLILILRVPSIIRRVGRFAEIYWTNLKFKLFAKKIRNTESSVLEKTKLSSFSSICEFLKPKEIGKMMVLNKTINKRVEKKLIWDNLYLNYYEKKINNYLKYVELLEINNKIKIEENRLYSDFILDDTDTIEIKREKERNKQSSQAQLDVLLKYFEQKEFEVLSKKFFNKSYPVDTLNRIKQEYQTKQFEGKVLCQKAQNSFIIDFIISEKLRDKFIGLTNVMIEETFESIFKSPHLILLPFKIISIPIIYIGKLFGFFYIKIFESTNEIALISAEKKIYNEIIANNIFYNIQLYGIFSLFIIIAVILKTLLTILNRTYLLLLRILSFKNFFGRQIKIEYQYNGNLIITKDIGHNSIRVEFEELSFKEFIYFIIQHFLATIVLGFHVFIFLIPTIYFKYKGINNIYHRAFLDDHRLENHLIYNQGKSPFLSGLNWWIFFEGVFDAFWNLSFSEKIYFIFGNYFLNIVSFILTVSIFIHYSFELRGNLETFPYYSMISNWLELMIENLFRLENFYNIIYPQIFIFKVYKFVSRRLKFLNNKILLNLVSALVILFPFYLNFKVKLSLFRFTIINTWAVTSFIKFSLLCGK